LFDEETYLGWEKVLLELGDGNGAKEMIRMTLEIDPDLDEVRIY